MMFLPSAGFLTGSVGTGEWIVLFVVVLIVVGPKRLPEIARKIGRTMEMFRRAADEFKDQLLSMDQDQSSASSSSSTDHEEPSYDDGSMYPDVADYPGNETQVDDRGSPAESADVEGASDRPSVTEPDGAAEEKPKGDDA